MCIIAIKEKGIDMPDKEILKVMFENNPDGCGFMYAIGGVVHIEKGFMTFDAFIKAVNRLDLKDVPVVMHFRIATSGGIDKGICHPFPISDKRKNLVKCHTITDVGVVHNGIIPISAPKNMSDTMQYITSRLSIYKAIQPDFHTIPNCQKRIEKEIKSKMVFLDNKSRIVKIGEFIEDKGIWYSNTSYMPHKSYCFYDWDKNYYAQAKLCPVDGYLVDFEGNLLDCEDEFYLMNRHGKVYRYDFMYDMAVPVDANAFTYAGTPCLYEESEAIYFNTEEML